MFSTVCYLFSGGKQEFAKGENERDHSDLAHDAGSDFVEKNGTIYHLVAGLGLLHFFIFSAVILDRVRVNVAEDLCHKMLVDGKSVPECLMVKDACLQISWKEKHR